MIVAVSRRGSALQMDRQPLILMPAEFLSLTCFIRWLFNDRLNCVQSGIFCLHDSVHDFHDARCLESNLTSPCTSQDTSRTIGLGWIVQEGIRDTSRALCTISDFAALLKDNELSPTSRHEFKKHIDVLDIRQVYGMGIRSPAYWNKLISMFSSLSFAGSNSITWRWFRESRKY